MLMPRKGLHFRVLLGVSIGLIAAGFAHAQPESGTYKPPSKPKSATKSPPAAKSPAAKPKSGSTPTSRQLRKDGEAIFGGGGKPASGEGGAGGETSAAPDSSWSIIIKAFRGDGAAEEARLALDWVRNQAGLREAYLEQRGQGTVVVFGSYADGTSPRARADLDRVRNTEVIVDGERGRPFAAAFLAPPAEIMGSVPEFDLRNAQKLHGDWALYTLQIGVYSREDRKPPTPADLAEFRRTAEQAALQLRREGEQAYYFHGPNRSSVTIGLFGEEDFDPQSKTESPAIMMLRRKFPHNLQNGLGIKQRVTVTDPKTGRQVKREQLQRSALMVVPKPE